MKTKTSIIFQKRVFDYIRTHLEIDTSGKEIYGWLIGFEEQENLYIIATIPCFDYEVQTAIEARPKPRELNFISNSLPEGLGVVGMYHSHPNEVYHSQTDDGTVFNFGAIYHNFVSVVTNKAGDRKVYRITDFEGRVISQVDYKIGEIPDSQKFIFQIEITGKAAVDEDYPLPSLARGIRSQVEKLFKKEPFKIPRFKRFPLFFKKSIKPGMRIKTIPNNSKIVLRDTQQNTWKDSEAPTTKEINYQLTGTIKAFYPQDQKFSSEMIQSIKLALKDQLMKKAALGQITNGELQPAKMLTINYLEIPLTIPCTPKSNQKETIDNLIEGIAEKSELLFRMNEKEYAKDILQGCKKYFLELNDKNTVKKITELLAKV
ncbi:MAG: hypothetical protein GF308_10000 [Candidatus Heimdallarchaeota archaeon]|nr:hypothetical protein [Candidatus Heimdallarchaeota archaeon]